MSAYSNVPNFVAIGGVFSILRRLKNMYLYSQQVLNQIRTRHSSGDEICERYPSCA